MKKLLIVAASICAVPIAGIAALILSSMNLFAVAAVVCAAPVACIFAIIVFRKIKYRSWRRLKARVVSVETKERPISADVSETPTHIASVTFSCDGHSYDATMPPERDNNAPEVGSEIDILFDPATVRAVSAYGLADRMRAFLALAFIADLAAFAIFIGIWSDDFDGFPKIPLFWRPLLGLPMFAGAVMLVRRYTSTRRRADAGKLRPIRAAFAGYRLHRDRRRQGIRALRIRGTRLQKILRVTHIWAQKPESRRRRYALPRHGNRQSDRRKQLRHAAHHRRRLLLVGHSRDGGDAAAVNAA